MTYEGGTLSEPWEDRRGQHTRGGWPWRVTERKASGEILAHKFHRQDEAQTFYDKHNPERGDGDGDD